MSIFGNDFAGIEKLVVCPVPTSLSVSESYTLACRRVNLRGKKFSWVLNCREAYAGNEKLVGEREKIVGTALAQEPEALTSGAPRLKSAPGTRGIVKARIMATLHPLQSFITFNRETGTHRQHRPKRNQTRTLRVK